MAGCLALSATAAAKYGIDEAMAETASGAFNLPVFAAVGAIVGVGVSLAKNLAFGPCLAAGVVAGFVLDLLVT